MRITHELCTEERPCDRLRVACCILTIALTTATCGFSRHAVVDLRARAFNAGTVLQGTRITHRFEFENNGTAALIITEVKAPCSCSSAVPSPLTAPGQSGFLLVSIDTAGKQGPVRMKFRVMLASATIPMVELVVEAVVLPEFALSERYLDFGMQRPGDRTRRTVTIQVIDRVQSRVVGVRSTDPGITAWLEAPAGKGAVARSVRVVAAQEQSASVGSHFGNLIIETTSPLLPLIRVPVRGRIAESVQ